MHFADEHDERELARQLVHHTLVATRPDGTRKRISVSKIGGHTDEELTEMAKALLESYPEFERVGFYSHDAHPITITR